MHLPASLLPPARGTGPSKDAMSIQGMLGYEADGWAEHTSTALYFCHVFPFLASPYFTCLYEELILGINLAPV